MPLDYAVDDQSTLASRGLPSHDIDQSSTIRSLSPPSLSTCLYPPVSLSPSSTSAASLPPRHTCSLSRAHTHGAAQGLLRYPPPAPPTPLRRRRRSLGGGSMPRDRPVVGAARCRVSIGAGNERQGRVWEISEERSMPRDGQVMGGGRDEGLIGAGGKR